MDATKRARDGAAKLRDWYAARIDFARAIMSMHRAKSMMNAHRCKGMSADDVRLVSAANEALSRLPTLIKQRARCQREHDRLQKRIRRAEKPS